MVRDLLVDRLHSDYEQMEIIWKIKQASGDDSTSTKQIKEWHSRFENDRTTVESEAHYGRP